MSHLALKNQVILENLPLPWKGVLTPRLDYVLFDDKNNIDNCAICLEEINTKCVKLKCNHVFHKNCIKKWIDETRKTGNNFDMNCPLCKTNIV